MQTHFVLIAAVSVLFTACACASSAVSASHRETPEFASEAANAPVEQDVSETFFDKLAVRLRNSDYEGALLLFDELPPGEAGSADMRILKTSVYISAGAAGDSSCFEKGRALITSVIEEDGENLDARFTLARLEGAAGSAKLQVSLLEGILTKNAEYVPALNALGDICVNSATKANWKRAASLYDTALKADGTNLDSLVGRARVYRYNKDTKNAEGFLTRAAELHPNAPSPLIERASLRKEAGHFADAVSDLEKAETLDPDNHWITYDKGCILVTLGRKSEALNAFTRVIERDKTNFSAYVYSAGIKFETGDWDGAESDFQAVRSLNPSYFFASEGVGLLKMRKHEYAAARDAFVEAYEHVIPSKDADEDSPCTYAILAGLNWLRTLKTQNDRSEMKAFLDKVTRLGYREYSALDLGMLRLLQEASTGRFSGDSDFIRKLDGEKDTRLKSRMTYYLGEYYNIQNNQRLARSYFEKAETYHRIDTIEWRLIEWSLGRTIDISALTAVGGAR